MKNKEKELNKDHLDEAVALVLKYKSELSELQLKALYFSLYVEQIERDQNENKL